MNYLHFTSRRLIFKKKKTAVMVYTNWNKYNDAIDTYIILKNIEIIIIFMTIIFYSRVGDSRISVHDVRRPSAVEVQRQ